MELVSKDKINIPLLRTTVLFLSVTIDLDSTESYSRRFLNIKLAQTLEN